MKIGQIKQYRQKLGSQSPKELAEELVRLRKEQFSLRMQRATGQQPKPNQFNVARRNIARVKTQLRKQQLAAKPAGGK
jgi:large subunit ribosomal protein L29